MSSSPPTETPAAFVCDCDWLARSACEGLPFYKKYESKRYCVLHYPGKEKRAAFAKALKGKLDAEDYNFRGVWFPDNVLFGKRTFVKPVIFYSATFSASVSF